MNAAAYLLETGRDDRVAIESWDERITYAELRDAVARAAGAWRELGLARDERVLVFAPDSIDWVIAYLGAIWAGGVAVGLNSRLFERELGVILRESETRLVWCDPESVQLLERLTEGVSPPLAPVTAGEFSERTRRAEPVPAAERGDEEMAYWLYTSGTTGLPKAVIHAQRMVKQATDFATGVIGIGADDRIYATSKLFFAYSLGNGLFSALRLGATLVVDREWPTAERVAEMAAHHEPTALYSVPTLYLKMLQTGVAPRLGTVRHFVSAGEALPASLRSAWLEATGIAPVNAYGATETVLLVLYCDDDSGLLRPSPRARLLLPEPPPEPGAPHRLWIEHPSVALGYWRRPEAEHDAFRDGRFSPGDLFRAHEGRRWEFCGRDDDMLKISGQWVSILDVEQALVRACGDAVQELAAVGFANQDGLSSIAVFAVPAAGSREAAGGRLEAAIAALPKLKRPREVRWLDELPKTATGKLQRRSLRETYLDQA